MDTDILLGKTPLAEAVWLLWDRALPDATLNGFFETHRGRCYERALSFAQLVHLTSDALCQHGGSGRQALLQHAGTEQLPATEQAFYGKLRRLPLALSEAFLADGAERLRSWLPHRPAVEAPAGLREFRIVVFDGKTFKQAAKRLKPVRDRAGRGLGGRALVALELSTGLLLGMAADPDAHVNEAALVHRLLPQVRQRHPGPRLWVADRQFGDLAQVRRCTEEGDHCVLRLHKNSRLTPDPTHAARHGTDALGRAWTDEVGTLHSIRQGALPMRRITLERPGQPPLVLVTDLWDADAYPANDLLQLYKQRWGIETVFQHVSDVFHLSQLIGSSPQAIVFQGALCMMLYNLLQVVRAIIADTQNRAVSSISTPMLWLDLKRALITLHYLLTPDELVDALRTRAAAITDLHRYLHQSLKHAWTSRWIKSPSKKRHRQPVKHQRGTAGHFSIHRILVENKKAKDV